MIHIIKKIIGKRKNIKEKYFNVLSDLLVLSINRQNKAIEETIARFMYSAFEKQREKNINKQVDYPKEYYEVIYKATEELALKRNNRLKILEHRISSLIWLTGEYKDSEISENTYSWLWRILRIPVEYKNDDMILNYWRNAHQYFRLFLQKIIPEYSDDFNKTTNLNDIDERNKERERFKEFHYALGGLLMYRGRHNCLKRIFNYTTSLPPDYAPLPNTMDEIFKMYYYFSNTRDLKIYFISDKYSFPDAEGIYADGVIKKWISKYITLLFLRQYTLYYPTYGERFLALPELPEKQGEKRFWLDNLDFFEGLVKEILTDNELLKSIGFDFLSDKWCEDNKKPKPIDFIYNLREKLIESFEKSVITQKISKDKLEKFIKSSEEILVNTFSEYEKINNRSISGTEFNQFSTVGQSIIFDKSAFADFQEADYTNYDTFVAESLADRFKQFISETFYFSKSESYILKEKDIFEAINKLDINGRNFLIVGFRHFIGHYIKELGIQNLTENKYKDIEIINYNAGNYHLVDRSFFILKKSDLPFIDYWDTSDEEKSKYNLSLINEKYKIYANVVDLNINEKLRLELVKTNPDKDLRKFVLAVNAFKAVTQWKKNIKCIQLQCYSKFQEKGLPNNLKDIKKF